MKPISLRLSLSVFLALIVFDSNGYAAEIFASPVGFGSSCTQSDPCSLQTAMIEANDGDTVYAAQGTYTGTGSEVVTITKTINLLGGWDGSATGAMIRNTTTFPSILDGENARRVIVIQGDISPTIDGFTVRKGNASNLGGAHHQFITPDLDAGGGIYSTSASPTIKNNIITGNVASGVKDARAMGGGVYIQDSFSPALVSANEFRSNTAAIGETSQGEGGAIFVKGSAHIFDNDFFDNQAKDKGGSYGGAICAGYTYGPADIAIFRNYFEGNSADRGGAINIAYCKADINSNTFLENLGGGPGVYLYYDYGSSIRNNLLFKNIVTSSGVADHPELQGVIMVEIPLTKGSATSNIIADNKTDHQDPTKFCDIYTYSDWHLGSFEIIHNTVVSAGNGITIGTNVEATIQNNIVSGHAVGITTYTDPLVEVKGGFAQVQNTLFWQNTDNGITGSNPVYANPLFVDPASSDYHLSKDSAARDVGAASDVTLDFEGDGRPFGPLPDIGADEYRPVLYVEPAGLCGGRKPCYDSLADALSEAETGATIMIASGSYEEGPAGFQFNRDVALTMVGGLDPSDFAETSSPTVIDGLQILQGTLTVYTIQVRDIP